MSQAFLTAAPFRSVPQEAAVAEVFGTLSVRVGMTRTRSGVRPSSRAAIERDVGVHALAHLGAAVIHLRGAVLIKEHERAGLIEMRGRKRDAEFHRRDREAALAMWMLRVPFAQLARGATANSLEVDQLVPDALDAVVLDLLAVMASCSFRRCRDKDFFAARLPARARSGARRGR